MNYNYLDEGFSLCEVIPHSINNHPMLNRLLDYNQETNEFFQYQSSSIQQTTSFYFNYDNEKSVFVGDVNVWSWEDGNRDKSKRIRTISPIEVMIYHSFTTIDEFLNTLVQDGVPYAQTPLRTIKLLVIGNTNAGLLFKPEELVFDDNTHKLFANNTVYSAQLYENLVNEDFLVVQQKSYNKRIFFRKPYSSNIERKKIYFNLESIIKEEIIKRLETRVKPKALKDIKEVIAETPREEILTKVMSCTGADETACEAAIDRVYDNIPFINQPHDVKILSTILELNEELYQKCVERVEENWKRNHQEAEEMINAQNERKNQLQNEIAELEQKRNASQTLVDQNEIIIEQFADKLEELILEFQDNTGGFLASAATLGLFQRQSKSVDYTSQSLANKGALYSPGQAHANTSEVSIKNIFSLLCQLEDAFNNLIDRSYSDLPHFFGAYLYALYCRRQAIAMIGAGAIQIIEQFSYVVNGKSPDVLNCDGEWDQEAIDQAFADRDSILIVKNPFNGAWFDRLIVEISQTAKMVVLIAPFADDLRIEPQGLFDHVIPIVTEPLLDSDYGKQVKPSVRPKAEEFEHFKPLHMKDKKILEIAQQIGMKKVLRNTISQLVVDAVELVDTENKPITDIQKLIIGYAFCLYPYAVLTGNESALQNGAPTSVKEFFAKAL